jgi:peptidoglycan/xylan/chitin deacetylase (PgdA/CDA1 family)
MKLPQNVARILAALAAFGATVALTGGSAPKHYKSRPPRLQVIQEQIEADVQAALKRNAEAKDLADWQESGFTATDIVDNARALRAETALCRVIEKLPDSDLALFGDEIQADIDSTESVERRKKLPCGQALMRRIRAYWEAERLRLTAGIEKELPVAATRELPIDPARVAEINGSDFQNGQFALTFDDGPHPQRTARLLGILRDAGVRATFFQVGQQATRFPEISRLVLAEGHTVASHSLTHANLPRIPMTEAEREIDRGHAQVLAAAGEVAPFFRFPYGARNPELREHVSAAGMTSFMWNIDSLDWQIRQPEALWQNIKQQLDARRSGVILFHDIHEQTLVVLPLLLNEFVERGYEPVVFVKP